MVLVVKFRSDRRSNDGQQGFFPGQVAKWLALKAILLDL